MVKEFQSFHVFLIAMLLLLNRVVSYFIAQVATPTWSAALILTFLVLVVGLIVYFASHIGMGLLSQPWLRKKLLSLGGGIDDPAGRYCYAMIDSVEQSVIGYLVMEIGFESGSYIAAGKLYEVDHTLIGRTSFDNIAFLKAPQGSRYDRLSMTCLSTYDNDPQLPLSGMMVMNLHPDGGQVLRFGELSYSRFSSPLNLWGRSLPDVEALKNEQDASIRADILENLNPNLKASSYREFIRNHAVKGVDLSMTNKNISVSCDSLAYANAWKSYLAGCEGHGLRNRLFMAIASYAKTDKRIADRTGDQKLNVLDLGCGNGIGGFVLSETSGPITEYIGVDCNDWLLKTITWHESLPTRLRSLSLDLSTPESLEEIVKVAKDVDVILMVRVLNHLDAEASERLMRFAMTKYPDALLITVNPRYKRIAVDPDEGAKNAREILNSQAHDEAFNGVEYAHYPRTVAAYTGAASLLGYSHVNAIDISVSGLAGDVTHILVAAANDLESESSEAEGLASEIVVSEPKGSDKSKQKKLKPGSKKKKKRKS